MLRGMHASEYFEERTFLCGCIWNARVTEHCREERCGGDHENECGDHFGGRRSVEPLEEQAKNELRMPRLLPGQGTKNTKLHCDVDEGNARDRNEHTTRNIALGIFDLRTKMTDIVIAQVAIHALAHRL